MFPLCPSRVAALAVPLAQVLMRLGRLALAKGYHHALKQELKNTKG